MDKRKTADIYAQSWDVTSTNTMVTLWSETRSWPCMSIFLTIPFYLRRVCIFRPIPMRTPHCIYCVHFLVLTSPFYRRVNVIWFYIFVFRLHKLHVHSIFVPFTHNIKFSKLQQTVPVLAFVLFRVCDHLINLWQILSFIKYCASFVWTFHFIVFKPQLTKTSLLKSKPVKFHNDILNC